MPDTLIRIRGLARTYERGATSVRALRGVDLDIARGEFVAIMGRSGSGKSTLLQLLGALDRPTSGFYELDGEDVFSASSRRLSRLRSERIGFVFQTFHLLDELTVLENVCLPFGYRRESVREAKRRALAAIDRVGLTERLRHTPNALSGGEMQRVAIARALAVEPALILADEPTGNLDEVTSEEILGLLEELNADGATLVLVTHDPDVAERASRTLRMHEGMIE
ncbi:MAG: putative ABC transport system ATP-binding protein [Planctomycetota bacterium]|jgi:putative ABC transport system ATP-binding protein